VILFGDATALFIRAVDRRIKVEATGKAD